MSFLDVEVYDKIGVPAKRTAIIITNITKEDPHYNQIAKDVNLIQNMLRNLGFPKKRILLLQNKAKNVIFKETSKHCTFGKPSNEGYIMMFNLTYKRDGNNFRSGQSWYTSYEIADIFTANNLNEWTSKPKLIFYQSPLKTSPNDKSSTNVTTDAATSKIEISVEVDIFESFSGTSTEDSYGDEKGSIYIQALCETINQHIANKTIQNKTLNLIMYEVYANIKQRIENANQIMENGDKMGPQTPFHQSTHVKNFIFPPTRHCLLLCFKYILAVMLSIFFIIIMNRVFCDLWVIRFFFGLLLFKW